MTSIQPPVEVWEIICNINASSSNPLIINDIPNSIRFISFGQVENSLDPIKYPDNTAASISSSLMISNLALHNQIIVSEYLHTHSDLASINHIHYGLDILTGGEGSDADSLHTHNKLVKLDDLPTLINNIIGDGSNTDLTEFMQEVLSHLEQIDAALMEPSVVPPHTILDHLDDSVPFTMNNFRKLFNGSNADCLHVHAGMGGVSNHNDLKNIDGGDVGEYYHLTLDQYEEITSFFASTDISAAEAEILTNGSNADSLHTHSFSDININPSDLISYFTVKDEGTIICSTADTLNFIGATVQAKDCINGQVNIYIPPPSYVSHFNTSDGTNDCSVSDISVTSRLISSPTVEGTPFNIGDWIGGTAHNAIDSSSSSISYSSVNVCSFIDNSSTTIEVNIYDADGSSILVTHTTASITGNTDVTSDNIRIQVTSWGINSDQYQGIITVSFDIDTILTANSLDSGRFSVEIIHHNGSDGDFDYTQNDIFYDDESQTQVIGNATIAENTPVIVYKSGVQAYDTGSTFTVAIDDLDYLNTESYPQYFVRIIGTEYGLPTLTLEGSDLTGWTNSWNNTNSTYSNAAWAINASSYFIRTASANITAQTIDWGSWGEDSDDSPDASIIVDTYNDSSTSIYEGFTGEDNRIESDLITSWDSTESLVTADGGIGLQVGEGTYLFYPGHSGMSPSFPTANGDYTDYEPNSGSQPDYSALSGTRYYYRGMWHTSTSHSNGIFNITGVTETDIANDDVIIEISLNGTDWYNCNESYLSGVLSDGDGCRIDISSYNLTDNSSLRFTLGQGGITGSSTGPGWGIWIRISMPATSTVQMNKIEITDWI